MAKIRVRVQQLEDRHFFVQFSDRVGAVTQTLKRAGKNGRLAKTVAGYFGFEYFNDANRFAAQVKQRFPNARIQVRPSKRLTGCMFEVKVCHLVVEQLIADCLKQATTTSQRIERHLKAVATMPSVQPDGPSDRRYAAPQASRGSGRATVMTRSGHCVGIE
jgi:hypothetical protein